MIACLLLMVLPYQDCRRCWVAAILKSLLLALQLQWLLKLVLLELPMMELLLFWNRCCGARVAVVAEVSVVRIADDA